MGERPITVKMRPVLRWLTSIFKPLRALATSRAWWVGGWVEDEQGV